MTRTTLNLTLALLAFSGPAYPQDDVQRLADALHGPTPMIEDLRALTDRVGGRATGSAGNRASVQWALQRFRDAGVTARAEAFIMPAMWLERSASGTISGDAGFPVRLAAMPFSGATVPAGLTARLLDGGHGTVEDFTRLGAAARGAWVLIETAQLRDIEGLFREYAATAEIERRAWQAGAAGIAYQSSRAEGILARHNAALGWENRRPAVMMERGAAARALRLLRGGAALRFTARLALTRGGPYTSHNVIGEIPGATRPEEFVVIGAHLDAWDLGQGALDNGANVAILIDVARQITRLGLRPARTIRFVLWNGEEQGFIGSWRYTQQHADELDRTVLASSFDIGTGAITGFFTGGRPDMVAATTSALAPLASLGPFQHADVPIVGTDNYDFMMQGVPNLVANHEPATYGPNYHASTDTFDKADTVAMRRNAAITAAVAWYWANAPLLPGRHTMAQVEALVESAGLRAQMHMMGDLLDRWNDRTRPRRIGPTR